MGATLCCNSDARGIGREAVVEKAEGTSTPSQIPRRFGWKRDVPDCRDRVLVLPKHKSFDLPACVDLRKGKFLSFPVYDQGKLESCTANAICAGFHVDQLKQDLDWVPSRLFIYYNQRKLLVSAGEGPGACIRDGIKSVHQVGVCSEGFWLHNEAKFEVEPDDACYLYARKHKCLEYARVKQTLGDMRACLSEGFPFVFGFTVFSSFCKQSVTSTGQMPMPQVGDDKLGGHAALCVGYDDAKRVFIVRNSWGPGWGDEGYFYMPYAYISDTSLAGDLWTMRNIDGEALPTEPISKHRPPAAPAAAAEFYHEPMDEVELRLEA